MAFTCVWFPYPDSACLVLGCVRVLCAASAVIQRKICRRSWAASRCVLLSSIKISPAAACLCLAAALAGGGPRFGQANALTPVEGQQLCRSVQKESNPVFT